MKRIALVINILLVAAMLAWGFGCAKPAPEETFPSEPIHLLIGGNTGSAYDTVGRKVAPTLGEKLGVKVLPMNVTGPKHVDMFDAIYKAKPDGYRIAFFNSVRLLGHTLVPDLLHFDVNELPILLVIKTLPDVVFASPKSKFKTADDLLNAKEPIRVSNYASLVLGLAALVIVGKERNLDIRPVAFGNWMEANLATIRGDVDIMNATGSGTTLKKVESGEYVPLFVWGAERYDALPNVPSSRELGLPQELEATMQYRAFVTTPGTPTERIAKLTEGLTATLTDPKIVQWGKEVKQPLTVMSAEDFVEAHMNLLNLYKQNWDALQGFVK